MSKVLLVLLTVGGQMVPLLGHLLQAGRQLIPLLGHLLQAGLHLLHLLPAPSTAYNSSLFYVRYSFLLIYNKYRDLSLLHWLLFRAI